MAPTTKELMTDAADNAGWDESTQLELALRFIEEECDCVAFADFLDNAEVEV